MQALPETTAVETLAGDATASLSAARSIAHHKHQMFGHSRAGLTRGVCRVQAPAAYEPQACELGRGDVSPVPFQIQIGSFLPLPQLGVKRCSALPRLYSHRFPVSPHRLSRSGSVCSLAQTRTYSRAGSRCTASLLNTLADQQLVNALADRLHLSNVLFSGCSVREVSCATKGLGNVRKAFGEIRNV